MREAVATTVSPDCDRRLRLPLMRLRASRAVRRLVARISFAWMTRCCEAVFTLRKRYAIFARFGKLCMAAAAAGEGVHHASRGVREPHERAREPPGGLAQRVAREREQHFAAGEQRGVAYRVAV